MGIDWLAAAGAVLSEFMRSDVGAMPPPRWHGWLAGSVAHFSIGAGLALTRVPFAVVCLIGAAWAVKELTGDIPGDDYALATWADSTADLLIFAVGYIALRRYAKRMPT